MAEKSKKENELLEKLVAGVNDVFEKEYEFKELDLKFLIKVRYPNFIQRAKVNARREELLFGTGLNQSMGTYIVTQTLCLLDECGIDVPDYFNLNGYPREDVVFKIGMDLNEWLDSFR